MFFLLWVLTIIGVGILFGIMRKRQEKLTKELTAVQNRLLNQEKLASLGTLTAGIAHEIKNPLNFINNFSSLSLDLIENLKPQKVDDERWVTLQQNLQSILEQGKKADHIIQRVLSHSRLEKSSPAPTDINQLLSDYIELIYHGLRASVQISKHFDPSIGKINIIAEDMGRVFLNLFNNALYAMRKKSEIDPKFTPILCIETINYPDKIQIRIKDNGTGMPQEIKEQLFTPFFTTKPAGEGTGLGLSLSHSIITQEHQGKLEFNSEEGKYTEFIITLFKNLSQ